MVRKKTSLSLDEDLLRSFKSKVALTGRKMCDVMESLIRMFLDDDPEWVRLYKAHLKRERERRSRTDGDYDE